MESSGVVSPAEGSCNGVVGGAVQRGEPSSGAQWTTVAQCSPVSCPGKPFSGGVVGVQQARGVAGEPCSGVVGGSRPAEAQWSCRSTSGVVGPVLTGKGEELSTVAEAEQRNEPVYLWWNFVELAR